MDDTRVLHGNAVTTLQRDTLRYRPPEPEPDLDEAASDTEDAWGLDREPIIDPRGRTRLIPPKIRHQDERPEPGYEPSKGEMSPRSLRISTTPTRLQIGRLVVRDAGKGWLMVTLLVPNREEEAELLPPAEALTFTKWISGAGRLN